MNSYKLTLLLAALLGSAGIASSEETTAPAGVKAPFKNYWDANSWEAGSSGSFWRATSQTPQPASPTKKLASRNSTPHSKGASPSTSSRTETNHVLHRQSEK